MNPDTIRALLERHYDQIADLVTLRQAADCEGEETSVRIKCATDAEDTLDGLAEDLAAELAARELVTA